MTALETPSSLPRPRMTWLVWRQHRGEALASLAVIAVLAIVVTPTALHLHQLARAISQGGCLGGSPGVSCGASMDAFNATTRTLSGILPLLNLLPALAGLFIGAPLVAREIEAGTWRLAWSQGVTRRAWLNAQLLGTLVVIAVAAGLLTAVLTWWLAPVDYVDGRFTSNGLDFYGVVPLAWSLLAFALGVLAGSAVRRVIPAMAVTLAVYAVIRVPVEFLLRPRYLSPLRAWNVPFSQGDPLPRNSRELGTDPVAPGGHTILTGSQFDQLQHQAEATISRSAVTSPTALLDEVNHWLQAHGYTQVITYQPAGRFWVFQGIEAGTCLILTIIALAAAYRLVLRRLA
jgi:hypothetical protein